MTAPAQAPTDQPTPATPDELAAIYLRARDVPCPGCGYNLRDGSVAACPECDHTLSLAAANQALVRPPARTIVAATIAMLLFSIPWAITTITFINWTSLAQRVISTIQPSRYPNAGIEWHHAVNIIEVVGQTAAIPLSIITLWAVRRQPHRASRWFAISVLCLAMGTMPFAWWNFYAIVLR